MANPRGAVAVEGFRDIQRALKHAEKDIRLGWRKELRTVAEPIRATAEALGPARIRGLGVGEAWSKMRIGITQSSVYVAPRERGYRGRQGGRSDARYKADQGFGEMMLARAMEPALYHHQEQVIHGLERMLDRACDKFNRGL